MLFVDLFVVRVLGKGLKICDRKCSPWLRVASEVSGKEAARVKVVDNRHGVGFEPLQVPLLLKLVQLVSES